MKNRHGLDIDYFRLKLQRITLNIGNYTPAEFARECGRMMITADAQVLLEREFGAGVTVQAVAPPSTPSSRWAAAGRPDPHAGHYDGERAALAMGDLTDDGLANGVFMNGNEPLNLERLLAKDPGYHPSIAWLTAAKDRIRWLSRALDKALASGGQP